MAINNISNSIRSAMCDAMVDAIDAGAGAGLIDVYTAAFGEKLATLTFTDPAFGAASNGVATASSITNGTVSNGPATAAVFRITTSNPTTCFEGTVGTSGADINFDSVSWANSETVSISSMTMTMPASA